MNAPTDPKQFRVQLKDAKLFHEQCYVDGGWADADSKQTIPVTNPATGGVIGSIPKMGGAETRRAIEAADRALPAWRARIAKERAVILRKWFELMLANQDDLALIMTTEQGKPLAEAKGEIAYAASFLEWFAEEGKRVYGDVIPTRLARSAAGRDQAAGRRVRRHHAVEFPGCDDHAQGRAGACGRLHDRREARDADAVLGACAWPSSPSAPACRRACSTSSPARRRRSAASSPPTRPCARSPSPAPPKSAAC